MGRPYHRMILRRSPPALRVPDGVRIRAYVARDDHAVVPRLYAEAFGEDPWPDDWDRFAAFDPVGVFLAEDTARGQAAGFVISFRLDDRGYVSVLAVVPAHRRRGITRALMATAIAYLRAQHLDPIMVDAFVDRPTVVRLYEHIGFRVEETIDDR